MFATLLFLIACSTGFLFIMSKLNESEQKLLENKESQPKVLSKTNAIKSVVEMARNVKENVKDALAEYEMLENPFDLENENVPVSDSLTPYIKKWDFNSNFIEAAEVMCKKQDLLVFQNKNTEVKGLIPILSIKRRKTKEKEEYYLAKVDADECGFRHHGLIVLGRRAIDLKLGEIVLKEELVIEQENLNSIFTRDGMFFSWEKEGLFRRRKVEFSFEERRNLENCFVNGVRELSEKNKILLLNKPKTAKEFDLLTRITRNLKEL